MKQEKELERTIYVLHQLTDHGLVYTGFPMNIENYEVDDAWLISLNHKAYPLENKSILGGWCFKEDGAFRDYFKTTLPNKMILECEIPEGTPIYYVNAETEYGGSIAKWDKIRASGACLTFLAADGIVLFSPKDLSMAFLGYGKDMVPHTTEFGKEPVAKWEKKAILDLSRGYFIPCDTPKELLTKDKYL